MRMESIFECMRRSRLHRSHGSEAPPEPRTVLSLQPQADSADDPEEPRRCRTALFGTVVSFPNAAPHFLSDWQSSGAKASSTALNANLRGRRRNQHDKQRPQTAKHSGLEIMDLAARAFLSFLLPCCRASTITLIHVSTLLSWASSGCFLSGLKGIGWLRAPTTGCVSRQCAGGVFPLRCKCYRAQKNSCRVEKMRINARHRNRNSQHVWSIAGRRFTCIGPEQKRRHFSSKQLVQ